MPNVSQDTYSQTELQKAFDKVKAAVFRKKNTASFYGSLLCSLDIEFTDKVDTAATDGLNIFINPDFYMSLPEGTRETVLIHEINHVAQFHLSRKQNRDALLWNIACDHQINLMLHYEGYSWKGNFLDGSPIETNICCDTRFNGMNAEAIYGILEKEAVKITIPMMDLTPSMDNGNDDNQKESVLTEEEIQSKILTHVTNAVVAAKMDSHAGSIPGEITEILDKYLNPVVPWEQILRRFMTQVSNDDYSYQRINRRFNDPFMPGRSGDSGLESLYYYFDVSGSVSIEDALRTNTELKAIKEEYNPEELHIIQFDTHIRKRDIVYSDDSFDELKIHGRGGTSLSDVYEDIIKKRPTCAVIFTDLGCYPMKDPEIPVIWIVSNNPALKFYDGSVPEFGTIINLCDYDH